MLYESKSLTNLPIISLDSGKILKSVDSIIIDPENGKMLGIVAQSGFWEKKKAISIGDIYEINTEAISVRDEKALVDIENIVRIKNIVDDEIFIINAKVITENGKKLGKVSDFVINADLGILAKIYVDSLLRRGYFEQTLVISASQIISIESDRIIVKNNISEEKAEEKDAVEEPAVG